MVALFIVVGNNTSQLLTFTLKSLTVNVCSYYRNKTTIFTKKAHQKSILRLRDSYFICSSL